METIKYIRSIDYKDAMTQTTIETADAMTQTDKTFYIELSSPIQTLIELNKLINKHKQMVECQIKNEIDHLLKRKHEIEEECNFKRQQIINEELIYISTKRRNIDPFMGQTTINTNNI